MKRGSWNTWLSTFEVGETRWVETSLADHLQDMRTINTPLSRRPEILRGRVFTTRVYTAVPAAGLGDIEYVLRVERLEDPEQLQGNMVADGSRSAMVATTVRVSHKDET